MSVRYSILVKQYALEKKAYEFFDLMKKNTEELGGFFTPLPSGTKGNIHSVNDDADEVLGYITSSAVAQKRFFISTSEVPLWRYYEDCDEKTTSNTITNLRYYFDQLGFMPYYYEPLTRLIFYSKPNCVDCTTRGGITQRPTYW